MNCQAPDTGNMELLHLLRHRGAAGAVAASRCSTARSGPAFAMTEPAVASSDATNIETSIVRDGDEYVINGRKWWTSRRRRPALPGADRHGQDRPRRRHAPAAVDGHRAGRHPRASRSSGRSRSSATSTSTATAVDGLRRTCGCRSANILGEEGGGFAAAQARLGPGRIHHVMRALGAGERALAMMVARAKDAGRLRQAAGRAGRRSASGSPSPGSSSSRPAALCHQAAYVIDSEGNKAARHLVAAAKVAVPRIVTGVIDRAIQVHGGVGVSDDTPLAEMYGWHRAMRIFDGPDEVHLASLARAELDREPQFRL